MDNLHVRISILVPEPDCDTFGNEYDKTVWRDSRPLPTEAELLAVDISGGVPKSTIQKIIELEASVTPRNYREFVMGNKYSIDKINQVEAEIAILRAKL